MKDNPIDREALAEEARKWDDGEIDFSEWEDAPEAIPQRYEHITLNIPKKMFDVLTAFARRDGMDFRAVIRKWLDERIRHEAAEMKGRKV